MDNNELKSKTVSGLFWKLNERVGIQLVRMLTMIVLARILTPEDYGAIALVMVFVGVCDVIVTSGLCTPLIQKKEADKLDFSTIFWTSLFLSFILFILIFISAPAIASFYEMPILSPVLRVLDIGVIISAIGSVQNAFVSRCLQFKTFFYANLIGLIISGVIGIWMAYCDFGIWALVGQHLTNLIISTILVFIIIKWKPTLEFSFIRLKGMWNFGWKIFVAALINKIFQDIRTLLIGKVYTKQDLAYYNQGNIYPHMIVDNVNTTINSVLFPAIALIQDDIPTVKGFLRRSIKTGSFLLFPVLLGFASVAKPLVLLVLTEKWLPSVPFIQVMCIALILSPISAPSQQAIKAIGRSDITMKQEIIKKTVFLVIIIATMFISVWAVVLGTCLGEIWCVVVNAFPCKKQLGYTFGQQIKDIMPNMFISFIMAGVIYSMNYIGMPLLLCLILQIIVGAFIYVILARLTNNESYIYLKNFCMEFVNNKKK